MLILLIVGSGLLNANNIQISNVALTSQNTVNNTTLIRFDASWENSWRTNTMESNWDAIWVFAKYRIKGQSTWNHATFDLTGHTGPLACKIDSVTDGKGVFIRAASAMSLQNVNYTNINLRWNYGTDGLQDNDSVDICVFAIEMVYVPQGSYYLGDGYSSSSDWNFKQASSSINLPFQITSESALILGGTAASNLGINGTGSSDDFGTSATQTLPASFPKGYNGFYCMKYEVSQGQYAEFLNKINSIQAAQRFPNTFGNRHNISGSWPNITSTTPHRGCNLLNLTDALAYADWAGLRPMSELEYEKACRGNAYPVVNEYAWGSTTLVAASSSSLINDGQPSETFTNSNANCVYGFSSTFGPVRCGWASGTSPGTRESTGSTYYGIRDMSGNLNELVVFVGSTTGRSFTATNGDGVLDVTGTANTSWPGVIGAYGTRGGNFVTSATRYLSVSSRYNANALSSSRTTTFGFRCVRSF